MLWESPREQGSYLTACFLIYSTQRWPSSYLLSPTPPGPTELELMGFPDTADLLGRSLEDLAHAHTSFCLGKLPWG